MKTQLPLLLSKIGKDRLVIILLFGLLLLVVLIPADSIDKATGQGQKQPDKEKSAGEQNLSTEDGGKGKSDKAYQEVFADSGYMEATQYAEFLAGELEEILKYMDGVGSVKVLVTVENTPLKIVEKDNPNERNTIYESDSEGGTSNTMQLKNDLKTVYTVDENGNEVPLVVRENAPDIEGVVVVAQGGGNENIKVHITEAIEALFGIEPHKIKVVKMKGE